MQEGYTARCSQPTDHKRPRPGMGGVDDGLGEGVDAGAVDVNDVGMEFEAGVEAKEIAGVEGFVEEGIGMTSFRKRLSKVSAI